MKVPLLCLCVYLLVDNKAEGKGLKEEFTWTRISYQWPSSVTNPQKEQIRRPNYGNTMSSTNRGKPPNDFIFPGATNNKINQPSVNNQPPNDVNYIYENNIPMGANLWKNKLFITVPRRRDGIPSTLNYVDMKQSPRVNPPLIPYPNWEINQLPSVGSNNGNVRERIVSVYRVAIDPCDRLWMIDTGIVEFPGNHTQFQPTSVTIIDLKTDQIIHRYNLKSSDLVDNTNLASLAVDTSTSKTTCDNNAYAYIPDLSGYGLIVFSLKDNDSWRIRHNYFYLEPSAGEFFIAGHNFQWNDGIFSVALSNIRPDGFRDVYFHSMAGTHLYGVSTKVLRNNSLATRSYHGHDFINIGDRGALSQTSASDLHKTSGILFLGLVNQNALGCWNTNRDLKDLSIVHKHDEKMIYPSDVKIANDNKVVVLTNTMPGFLYGRLNYDKVNFRVWMENVQDAVRGTNCEMKGRN